MLPSLFFWAQATSGTGPPNSLVFLVPRRWYSSLSLSSPAAAPNLHAFWAFLGALGFLFLLAVALQGPKKAIRQFFDIPGHVRLLVRSATRLRSASRFVAVAIGFTVFSWTAFQALTFRADKGKDDLLLLTRTRSHVEIAVEQGLHCSLTPFRDISGLGDNFLLLFVAALLVFRAAADSRDQMVVQDRDGGRPGSFDHSARSRSTRAFLISGCALLYSVSRIFGRFSSSPDLPIGGYLVFEVIVIPLIMIVSDGFLLSWLLTELRDAGFDVGKERAGTWKLARAIELMPAGMLACASLLPARYVATFTLLLSLEHLPQWVAATELGRYLRWQLGPGLADVQAVGLVFSGVVGVVAWGRGDLRGIPRGWLRLIGVEGGHVVSVLAMVGIAAGICSAVPYLVILLLPAQTWVLAAADSYSHYATLPIALWGVAALIELGRDSLPMAQLASADAIASETLQSSAEPVGY